MYKSPIDGRSVRLANYLVDLVCVNVSKKFNKPIGPKYWNDPEWSKFYKMQIRLAYQLMKIYSEEHLVEIVPRLCTLRDSRIDKHKVIKKPQKGGGTFRVEKKKELDL